MGNGNDILDCCLGAGAVDLRPRSCLGRFGYTVSYILKGKMGQYEIQNAKIKHVPLRSASGAARRTSGGSRGCYTNAAFNYLKSSARRATLVYPVKLYSYFYYASATSRFARDRESETE